MTPEELQDCIDKNQAIIDTSEDAAMVDQAEKHIEQLRQELFGNLSEDPKEKPKDKNDGAPEHGAKKSSQSTDD